MIATAADIYGSALFETVKAFGRQQLEMIARSVRHSLRRRPATGVFGDDVGARHLWDELRLEWLNGPTDDLGFAWDDVLYSEISAVAGRIAGEALTLASVTAAWEADGDERQLAKAPAISDDLIREAVIARLRSLADKERPVGEDEM